MVYLMIPSGSKDQPSKSSGCMWSLGCGVPKIDDTVLQFWRLFDEKFPFRHKKALNRVSPRTFADFQLNCHWRELCLGPRNVVRLGSLPQSAPRSARVAVKMLFSGLQNPSRICSWLGAQGAEVSAACIARDKRQRASVMDWSPRGRVRS